MRKVGGGFARCCISFDKWVRDFYIQLNFFFFPQKNVDGKRRRHGKGKIEWDGKTQESNLFI
jgi:hypothetical protein